jgi:hypothetical protein
MGCKGCKMTLKGYIVGYDEDLYGMQQQLVGEYLEAKQ